ncbi:MAG: transporter substrate-binding domain-containing protein [Wujia sp.]
MKKMRKFLAMALSAVMAMTALTACGSKSDDGASSGKKTAKVIEIELTDEQYAFGVDKTQPELLEDVNAFIAEIKENGTFDEICNHYFGDGTPVAVKSAALDDSKDQLVVATNAAFEPFEYTKGEDYYGIDMEIAKALADKLGKELVIQNMDFDAVCLSVGQQKCDIAMAGLTIKPDREEYVNFSDSYYSASQKLIVTSDNTEFDACKEAADVEAILNAKGSETKVGVQTGTTGQFYCEGDEDWGFTGYKMESVGYKNGSLAVQDLLNGNINYVIIDSAPAASITAAINEMQ